MPILNIIAQTFAENVNKKCLDLLMREKVCVCVRACVRACVRLWVCVCVYVCVCARAHFVSSSVIWHLIYSL